MRSRLAKILIAPVIIAPLLCLGGCETLTPTEAVELLHNPTRPDARREGIAALATRWPFGKQPPYPEIYKKIAEHDTDYVVRAMAIRALNLCRDASATKIFIDGLKDQNELIRLESAKALANIPDPDAIKPLSDALTGSRMAITGDGHSEVVAESKDVRIAAADALRRYRNLGPNKSLDVARTLTGYLGDLDFGVAWQSRQSLIAMTGQDLGYNESAWLDYLVGPSKPFG